MKKTLGVFLPLYTTTLLLLGSGLLTTYVSLRLTSIHVSSALIGAIIAANYIGLVIGGKVGHFLIARVGHIRAYVACAGIITAAVLSHGLTEFIPAWVALRLVIGLCMMCQYMVLESWLNDQAESNQRGMVFGFYMAATYLGMSRGQIVLMLQSNLGIATLLVIALCFALCLVPIALTTRTNARHMSPALNPTFDEQIIHDTMPPPEAAPDVEEPQPEEQEAEPSAQGADPEEDTGLKKAHAML